LIKFSGLIKRLSEKLVRKLSKQLNFSPFNYKKINFDWNLVRVVQNHDTLNLSVVLMKRI